MKAPSPLAVVVGGLSAEQQPANGNIRSQPNSQILCQISLVHLKTSFIINIVTTIIARETPVICSNFGETALVTVRQEESCLIVGRGAGRGERSGLYCCEHLLCARPGDPPSMPSFLPSPSQALKPTIFTHFSPPSTRRKCLGLLGYWLGDYCLTTSMKSNLRLKSSFHIEIHEGIVNIGIL